MLHDYPYDSLDGIRPFAGIAAEPSDLQGIRFDRGDYLSGIATDPDEIVLGPSGSELGETPQAYPAFNPFATGPAAMLEYAVAATKQAWEPTGLFDATAAFQAAKTSGVLVLGGLLAAFAGGVYYFFLRKKR